MVAVPIIDLEARRKGERDPKALDAIDSACRDHGFFLITGHGLEEESEKLFQAAKAFFALPTTQKRALLRDLDRPMGYYDRELTKNKRDLKEVFDFTDDRLGELDASLVNRWPGELPAFRPFMLSYLDSCAALSGIVLRAVIDAMKAYDWEGDKIENLFKGPQTSFLRLNRYPAEDLLGEEEREATTPLGDMALHHHTDAGALTLLLQDSVGGLQCFAEGQWVDVTPHPGSFVVNIGDMVQVWSNDRYRSALHRVRPIQAGERLSAPYFYNPRFDAVIEPLPSLSGDAPLYHPFTWRAFRKGRTDGDFADYGQEIQISDFRTTTADASISA